MLRPWLAAQNAAAVVHTGDLVRLHPADRADRELAATELSAAVDGTRLVVPGNHDVGHGWLDDPEASIEGPTSSALVQAFRAIWGTDRFAHELGAWLLLGLNAHVLGTRLPEEAEQDDWLRTTVRDAGDRPLALFLHQPVCLRATSEVLPDTYKTLSVPPEPRRRLLDLLGPRLHLVASGHLHTARSAVIDGVAHVWAPSAAFTFPIEELAWALPLTSPEANVTGAVEYRFTDDSVAWGPALVPGLEPYVYRPPEP